MYVAISCDLEEIRREGLEVWVPVRTGTRGAKPGIGGKEARSWGLKEDEIGQWTFRYDVEPPEEIRTRLMGKVIELTIKACWNHQLHKFGGVFYHQKSGGPIGKRITMACSRLVMIMWGLDAGERLTTSGIKARFDLVYVDDGRYLISMVPEGWG